MKHALTFVLLFCLLLECCSIEALLMAPLEQAKKAVIDALKQRRRDYRSLERFVRNLVMPKKEQQQQSMEEFEARRRKQGRVKECLVLLVEQCVADVSMVFLSPFFFELLFV